MKKSVLSIALIAMITLISCKKETSSEENLDDSITNVETEVMTSGTYAVDTTASVINWTGFKPAATHKGTIALKDGNFEVSEGKITGGTFTIDMTSITVTDLTEETGKSNLEMHLKGTGEKEGQDHFFNTTKFPTSHFKINSVSQENGANTVNGTLTIKDIAKEVSFPATIAVADSTVTLTSSAFKIDRTLWGVNYASKSIFDDLKDKFVEDEIELTINVTAKK